MARVELRALTKVYPGGVHAVGDIGLTVGDGEFVVLVGPSGCGKSTVLRMIAGLETITSGDLYIDGRRVNGVEPGDRDIAMVFQNYALYPHMTARANMAYGLKNQGMGKAEIAERIASAAAVLRLEPYLDRKPRQLSGGQRQRVAMGRAIVREPKAFLFDEPLSNLDAKLRTRLRSELKGLHDRFGATFIYVTHDQVEAMSLADRIAVMNGGRIEQVGTPMELYGAPATRFVADFIGNPAMNFLDAALTGDRREVTFGNGARLGLDAAVGPAGGGAVTVGIRPEHLKIAAPGEGLFEVSVRFVERLGADSVVHGRIDGDGAELALRVEGGRTGGEGSVLSVTAAARDAHLFDAASGARLTAE